MADSITDFVALSGAPINVDNEYEMRYWCEKFRCTPQQLRAAVKRVGTIVDDVKRELVK